MINEIKDGYVKTDKEHGIVTIEFYHPQSNSLPGKLLDALAQAIHAEGINPQTKVIILRSGGDGVFCSGASFDELSAITNEKQGIDFFTGFSKVINAMRKTPKFIVVRVQGKCVGGGVGIVAAADYAIALEGSDVKLSELSVGIGPFVVGPAVERKIGTSAAYELAIDATNFRTAAWAKEKGLYAETFNTIEDLDLAIHQLANTLASSSSAAMQEIKKAFWNGTENWDTLLLERAAISGKLILTEEAKTFLKGYKAK